MIRPCFFPICLGLALILWGCVSPPSPNIPSVPVSSGPVSDACDICVVELGAEQASGRACDFCMKTAVLKSEDYALRQIGRMETVLKIRLDRYLRKRQRSQGGDVPMPEGIPGLLACMERFHENIVRKYPDSAGAATVGNNLAEYRALAERFR